MAQYATAYPDSRTRGKISLNNSTFVRSPKSSGSVIPTDLLLSLVLSKSLLAIALYITKEWLMSTGIPTLGIWSGYLILGAPMVLLFQKPWVKGSSKGQNINLPLYSLCYAGETLFYFMALSRMSIFRLIMFTQFNKVWFVGFSNFGKNASASSRNANFVAAGMLMLAMMSDLFLGPTQPVSGIITNYVCLAGHLLCSSQARHFLNPLHNDPASQARSQGIGLFIAAAISVPTALLVWLLSPSILTTTDPLNLNNVMTLSFTAVIPLLGLLAISMLLVDTFVDRTVASHVPVIRHVANGWPIAVGATAFVGYVAFEQGLGLADIASVLVVYRGISHVMYADPKLFADVQGSMTVATQIHANATVLDRSLFVWRRLRSYIKTVLENDDSKKIFFFLCLNLAYMFVQMLWGIWTNSLGLISDSIHMFFDCLALAMGLFASIMANWRPDQTFTYGYGRVETLSGFANGVFLILISIFIVFEAIQRLLDPPEMNTNQLLVVSFIGLLVNLVGMFATGHHHHGHSHGHDDHSHSHSHSHSHQNEHSHQHAHDHSHSDHHSHAHELSHDHSHAENEQCSESEDSHDHNHSSHGHSHGHSHNMKGVFLHVMADTLGSVGVIISTLLINRYKWTGFDPIASIFIAVLIFASVVPLVIDSAQVLCLELDDEKEATIRKALADLSNLEGVSSYSAPRFWPKDPSTVVGSIRIQLTPAPSSYDTSQSHDSSHHHYRYVNIHRVISRVEQALKKDIPGLGELSIQVEGIE